MIFIVWEALDSIEPCLDGTLLFEHDQIRVQPTKLLELAFQVEI